MQHLPRCCLGVVSLRIKFWPPPPTPKFLTKNFCLDPGLKWKFLTRRSCSDQTFLPLQSGGHQSPLNFKGKKGILVRTHFPHPESDGKGGGAQIGILLSRELCRGILTSAWKLDRHQPPTLRIKMALDVCMMSRFPWCFMSSQKRTSKLAESRLHCKFTGNIHAGIQDVSDYSFKRNLRKATGVYTLQVPQPLGRATSTQGQPQA